MFKVYGKLFSYIPKEKKYAYIAIVAIAVSAVLVSAGNYYIYRFLHSLVVNTACSLYNCGMSCVRWNNILFIAGAHP